MWLWQLLSQLVHSALAPDATHMPEQEVPAGNAGHNAHSHSMQEVAACRHTCSGRDEQESRGFGPATNYARCLPAPESCGKRDRPCCPPGTGNSSLPTHFCYSRDLMCMPGLLNGTVLQPTGVTSNSTGTDIVMDNSNRPHW